MVEKGAAGGHRNVFMNRRTTAIHRNIFMYNACGEAFLGDATKFSDTLLRIKAAGNLRTASTWLRQICISRHLPQVVRRLWAYGLFEAIFSAAHVQ